jgi:hypothetical protein
MQTICRCYLSELLSILGWLFVTKRYCNLPLPSRVNVFQQPQPLFGQGSRSLSFPVWDTAVAPTWCTLCRRKLQTHCPPSSPTSQGKWLEEPTFGWHCPVAEQFQQLLMAQRFVLLVRTHLSWIHLLPCNHMSALQPCICSYCASNATLQLYLLQKWTCALQQMRTVLNLAVF